MIEPIDETIDIVFISYAPPNKRIEIYKLRWKGREYTGLKITYHYLEWRGRTRIHKIHLSSASRDFRIELNTENLICTLKEVSDGFAH